MPSEPRKWKLRIRHMLDAIAECRGFVAGMSYDKFCADPKTVKAVALNLILIGEAARHVPDSVAAAYPAVPWSQMRGIRNHIVHGYDQIDLETVWKVVHDELPPLVPALERILQESVE